MPESVSGPGLHEQLARWTAEGLIDAGQAARIAAAEAARRESSDSPVSADQAGADQAGADQAEADQAGTEHPVSDRAARRVPLAVEALGYLGAALAVAAGFRVVPILWPDIHTSAELAVAAVAAVVFWAVGALLRIADEPSFRRLRTVLWLLSTAGIAAFVGVIAARIWEFGPTSTALVTSAVVTVYAVLLWTYNPTALQHLAMFAATAVVIGTAIARLSPGTEAWGPGLAVWATSLLWGTAAHRGYLAPLAAGDVAAGTGLLVGAQMTMETAAGHVLAIGTVAGLLAAGVVLRRVLLLGYGAVGIIVMVPQTATRYLPTSIGAPLAVFIVGLSLLAVVLWLAKSRKRPPSP